MINFLKRSIQLSIHTKTGLEKGKQHSCNHFIRCTKPGDDGNSYIITTNTWVQMLIVKKIFSLLFLGVFCVFQEMEGMVCSAVDDLS